ncbi:MAG: transposase [Mycobacterium sp.]|nr:transposase [Mycobacterium sp.]
MARGLIAAIEQVFPQALRHRCLIHRVRNVLAKIPAGMQAEIRDGYWACFDTDELNTEPGPRLVESVDARLIAFDDRYAAIYPAAMKILTIDREGLTAYLRFRPSIITASGIRTSSNAPSAKPVAAQRLSADFPVRPAASASHPGQLSNCGRRRSHWCVASTQVIRVTDWWTRLSTTCKTASATFRSTSASWWLPAHGSAMPVALPWVICAFPRRARPTWTKANLFP